MTDPINVSDSQDYNIIQSNYGEVVNYQTKIEDGSIYQPNLADNLCRLIAETLQSDPDATVEILVERLKNDDRLIQINLGNACAFQVLVDDGGTANVGAHLHDFDEAKLDEVLKALEALQPVGIPNNVPRSGVAKFIGREPELERLHTQLQQGNLVPISAVEGMGGVGKTELAIQYTQQHASSYEGGVCWLFAREFNVGSQIVSFAQSQLNLKIPEGLDLLDQVAFCWRNWRAGDVLLVMDDVVHYRRDVEPYLPPVQSRFKTIMTTRQKLAPPIQSLSLDRLSPEQALNLLTILVGEERVQQELEIACTLCSWLEGLPLGIELIGRYLLEHPNLSLHTLQFLLQEKAQKRQAIKYAALKQDEETSTSTSRRGAEAVFELSWGELDANSQHLGKLLSLFASAPIPWHLAEAVERKYCENSEDGKAFEVEEIEEARAKLIKLHLLQLSQQQEQVYRLHPLIREFFRSKLEIEQDKSTPEIALNLAFCQEIIQATQQIPRVLTKELVDKFVPLIPHLQEVATSLTDQLSDDEIILPFVSLGRLHEGQALYSISALWYEQCLSVARNRLGDSHPSVAISLSNLAYIYWVQGRYSEAEPLYLQALQLNIRLFGKESSVVANSLNDLAYFHESQGRYAEAEPLYSQALSLNQVLLGDSHPSIAGSLSNLAGLYVVQGRYAEAESLYAQALELNERALGEDHLVIASILNYLATLYYNQGRLDQAEALSIRSLNIRRRQLGDDHPDVATSFNNLAALYKSQGRFTEAEQLYRQSLEIRARQLGHDHPDTATTLNNLAALYESMERYEEAEELLTRSLEIRARQLGHDHPDTATTLNNLAALYESMERYEEAEPIYLRSLKIYEQTLGGEHPQVAQSLNNLAGLYKSRGDYVRAESLYLRSLQIREQLLGSHPNVATSLNNLAVLYAAQGKFDQAKSLFQRALEISQNLLGEAHPLSQSLQRSLEAVQ